MGLWSFIQSYFAEFVAIRILAILALVFIIARLTIVFFRKIVQTKLSMLKKTMQKRIVVKLETPIIMLITLAGIEIASRQILIGVSILPNLIDTGIIIIIIYMISGVMDILIEYWKQLHESEHHEFVHGEMLPLIKAIARIVFCIIGVILILQLWEVQVGALLASLGIIGVVLGFAFQDTMKNIFGGISLAMDNSLSKGDIIQLDTGEVGEVLEINFRSTKLKTFDDDTLVIPNSVLANVRFHNLAQPDQHIRVIIPIHVAYGSDPAQVKKVLLSTIKDDENILLFPKRDVRFMKMGDYSLDFDFLFFITDYRDKFYMIDKVTTKAYAALTKAGIDIPFPIRRIYYEKKAAKKPTAKKK